MAVSAGGLYLPNILRAQETPPSRRLGIAAIGCGGKGASDLEGASKENEVVAICDVDANTLAKAALKYPNAQAVPRFPQDARRGEGDRGGHGFHAGPRALSRGHARHRRSASTSACRSRSPTLSGKLRQMQLAAKKKGVITQMGNQGHTYDDNRVVKEWIAAGVIGKVKEVHVWTNRPIWPQGKAVSFKPGECPPILDWDAVARLHARPRLFARHSSLQMARLPRVGRGRVWRHGLPSHRPASPMRSTSACRASSPRRRTMTSRTSPGRPARS